MKIIEKYELKYITQSIRSGFQFREQLQAKENGSIKVVQMKDIQSDNTLDSDNLAKVDVTVNDPEQFLNKGDILFRSKGYNNLGTVIEHEIDKAVAQSYFFVIRTDKNLILPEYLAWYLNQKPAQEFFRQNSAGTSVPMISKKVLEMVEVVIPPMEIQQKIINIYNLSLKEQRIFKQLQEKKKLLIETILLKKVIE